MPARTSADFQWRRHSDPAPSVPYPCPLPTPRLYNSSTFEPYQPPPMPNESAYPYPNASTPIYSSPWPYQASSSTESPAAYNPYYSYSSPATFFSTLESSSTFSPRSDSPATMYSPPTPPPASAPPRSPKKVMPYRAGVTVRLSSCLPSERSLSLAKAVRSQGLLDSRAPRGLRRLLPLGGRRRHHPHRHSFVPFLLLLPTPPLILLAEHPQLLDQILPDLFLHSSIVSFLRQLHICSSPSPLPLLPHSRAEPRRRLVPATLYFGRSSLFHERRLARLLEPVCPQERPVAAPGAQAQAFQSAISFVGFFGLGES